MARLSDLHSFRAAVVDAVGEAARAQARTLVMVDPDFQEWPLDDPALIQALADFVRLPGRRVVLLARDYEGVRHRHPRFTAWRTTFAHAVDARVPDGELADLPSVLIVDRSRAVRVDDRVRWQGEVVDAPADVHMLGQQVDALVQRGSPGYAPTTLGL